VVVSGGDLQASRFGGRRFGWSWSLSLKNDSIEARVPKKRKIARLLFHLEEHVSLKLAGGSAV
jgi:hypothetical protein